MTMSPRSLRVLIAHRIKEQALWAEGDEVCVAVSGGRDSMALLHILHHTRALHQARLSVVTIDHRMHPHSKTAVAHVQAYCAELGVLCRRLTSRCQVTSEQEARAVRLELFSTLDADYIALGHHAMDRVEGFLLAAMRGGGVRALSNVRPKQGRWVRPLLSLWPDQVLGYCQKTKLPYLNDPTNQDTSLLRNLLRLEILPQLMQARPGAHRAILRSAMCCERADEGLLLQGQHPPFSYTWFCSSNDEIVFRACVEADPGFRRSDLRYLRLCAQKDGGHLRTWVVGGGFISIS